MKDEPVKSDDVIYIDDRACSFDGDKPIIRIAEENGVFIPRFCEHPGLKPVALCRQCIVEIEGERKLATACSTYPKAGMHVHTQQTSEKAKRTQEFMLELILINHPLDCPMCDKGGECPLQNQAFNNGRADSHFNSEDKRLFEKPIALSDSILLDRERCISCSRCTRFSDQIAGDPQIVLKNRGAGQEIDIAEGKRFISYFSVNTVHICPVGALTTKDYRFKARPFDLVSTRTTCENCAVGCSIRVDTRDGKINRVLSHRDDSVNREWGCNKGFLVFDFVNKAKEGFKRPLIRDSNGILNESNQVVVSTEVSKRLREAQNSAILLSGRLTNETYEAAKTLSNLLNTPLIDFRIRDYRKEENNFLAVYREKMLRKGRGVSYDEMADYDRIILFSINLEEEAPVLFLRIKELKEKKEENCDLVQIGEFMPLSTHKLSVDSQFFNCNLTDSLKMKCSDGKKTLIVAGESFSQIDGASKLLSELIEREEIEIMWAPRRSGEVGALLSGAFSGEFSFQEILRLIELKKIDTLFTIGLDLQDLAPYIREDSLCKLSSIIALDCAYSDFIKEYADVALPVQSNMESGGSFINIEGRSKTVKNVFRDEDVVNVNRVSSSEFLAKICKELVAPTESRTKLLHSTLSEVTDDKPYVSEEDSNRQAFECIPLLTFWRRGAAELNSKQIHEDYYWDKSDIIDVFCNFEDIKRYELHENSIYHLYFYMGRLAKRIDFKGRLKSGSVTNSKMLVPAYSHMGLTHNKLIFILKEIV
jgi:NADH-quinone oxidoreductase subunit G